MQTANNTNNYTVEGLVAKYRNFVMEHCPKTYEVFDYVDEKGKFHADDDYIYLASSVGSPDRASDEFIPLLIKVSRMGDVSISKDTQMDTKAVNPMPVPKNDAEEDDGV